MSRPRFLSECDPDARLFPSDWKDAWFRRYSIRGDDDEPVYSCPICKKRFTHFDLDRLEADHVWPYSLFGPTIWENYRLLCGACNSRRKDSVGRLIRNRLGSIEFRKLLVGHLLIAIPADERDFDPFVAELLADA